EAADHHDRELAEAMIRAADCQRRAGRDQLDDPLAEPVQQLAARLPGGQRRPQSLARVADRRAERGRSWFVIAGCEHRPGVYRSRANSTLAPFPRLVTLRSVQPRASSTSISSCRSRRATSTTSTPAALGRAARNPGTAPAWSTNSRRRPLASGCTPTFTAPAPASSRVATSRLEPDRSDKLVRITRRGPSPIAESSGIGGS